MRVQSNSSLACFLLCPRKYKHKYLDARVPVQADDTYDLRFGSEFHDHLQHRTVPEHTSYHNVRMAVLLEGYRHNFADHASIRREVDWMTGGLRGYFDGVGNGYLVEDKTTSSTSLSRYWDRKVLDMQVSLYLWAAEKCGIKADYVDYRVTRRPPGKPKSNEGLPEYYERYRAHCVKHQDGIFQAMRFERTPEQREMFSTSLDQNMQLIAHCEKTGAFPQNTNSCYAYNRFCEYLPVCSSETKISNSNLYTDRKKHK